MAWTETATLEMEDWKGRSCRPGGGVQGPDGRWPRLQEAGPPAGPGGGPRSFLGVHGQEAGPPAQLRLPPPSGRPQDPGPATSASQQPAPSS